MAINRYYSGDGSPSFENVWSGLFPSGDMAAATVMAALKAQDKETAQQREQRDQLMARALGASLSPPSGPTFGQSIAGGGYALGVDYSSGETAQRQYTPSASKAALKSPASPFYQDFLSRPVPRGVLGDPQLCAAMEQCLDGMCQPGTIGKVCDRLSRLQVPVDDIYAFENAAQVAFSRREAVRLEDAKSRDARARRMAEIAATMELNGRSLEAGLARQRALLRNIDADRAQAAGIASLPYWLEYDSARAPAAPAAPAVVDNGVRLEPIPTVALPEVKVPVKLRGELDLG